jgi:hypothetical protein
VVLSTFFKMGGGERGCGNSQIDWKTLDFGWCWFARRKAINALPPPTPIYNSWSIDELLEWPHSRVSNRSILLWCVYILGRFTAHRLSLMLSFY